MKQKVLATGITLLFIICLLCIVPAIAKTASTPPINTSDFSRQSTLHFFDDGSWVYSTSCSPMDDSRYQINVDFRCWGTDILTVYPEMTVVIWDEGVDDWSYIVANKLTINVAGNAYEYKLIEGNPPWKSDIRVGITVLLPSDYDMIKDLASARECTLIAETDDNTFKWIVKDDDYEKYFLPYIEDMLRFDFLHNVEESEDNEKLLMYAPGRTVYKNIGNESMVYDSGPDPEEGYSFSEDSAAIKQATQSVFYVEMYDEKKNCLGNASGFVSFDEHFFVTNEHVVDGASYIIVWDINDKSYVLDQVVAIDKDHDIAMLKFEDGSKYTSLKLDTNNNLRRGMPIVAIGSKGLQVASSTGIISALRALDQYAGVTCIQYSAPTSHESNGGCLLGDNGKVIGITSAIASEGQYIGVAVPVQYLLELYSKMKSNVYDVMDSSGSDNSGILEKNGKKKEDPTIITGGKINTIVAVSDDFDVKPFIMDKMSITVQDFLNKYNEIRRTTVKNAPAITSRTIKEFDSWDREYYINSEPDDGVGTRLVWKVEKDADINNLNVPLEFIVQFYRLRFYNTSLKENTKACLAVFSGDERLMDKMIDFYERNECRYNDEYVALLTSEGYLITYSGDNLDASFRIYYVAH